MRNFFDDHDFLKPIGLLSLCGLAACAATNAPISAGGLGAFTQEFGLASGVTKGPTAVYDAATDTLVFNDTNGAWIATFARDTAQDRTGFRAYTDGGTDRLVFLGNSASGDVSVAIAGAGPSNPGPAFQGGFYSRAAGTVLPTSGTATFNGNYVGLIQTADSSVIDSVGGTATLTANFANSTINGAITNRMFYNARSATGNGTLDPSVAGSNDITLLPAPITASGTYKGPTRGGEIYLSDTSALVSSGYYYDTVTNGQYGGLIGGKTGNETAGGVTLTHTIDQPYTETGAFIATK